MSLFDYLKRKIRDNLAPISPVTPPPKPPTDPEAAARHSEAMRRRAADVLRWHDLEKYALDYGGLPPPLPPSVGWYENHLEYKWNPLEPNPERGKSMSEEEIKQLPSVYGYFNWHEAQAVVLSAIGANTFAQLGYEVLLSLLRNSDKIYNGPADAAVAQICGVLAALMAGYVAKVHFVAKGE